MGKNIVRHLVINALLIAQLRRQPKSVVLLHSDQGSQYGSHDCTAFMEANNLIPSMSRWGNCHDNAVAESFFATLRKQVTRKKYTELEKKQKQKYLILLRWFTIRSSTIHKTMGYPLLNMKRRISRGLKVSSKVWEV